MKGVKTATALLAAAAIALLVYAAVSVNGTTQAQGDSPASAPVKWDMTAVAPTATDLGAFKDGKYVLPPLSYKLTDLEPLYDSAMLKLHYEKHHAAYVAALNAALEKLEKVRSSGDYSQVKSLSNDVAFNGSGHILHTLFWHSMKPGGAKPPPELAKAMAESFGSVDAVIAQFAQAAKTVEGSGWAVLAYEPASGRLLILQSEKHQNLTVWGVTPLLVCDVWEHAYYLQYQNRRADWVDNFLKLANWEFAAQRLAWAKRR